MGYFTKTFHNKWIYSRRMSKLTELLMSTLENSENILDLGCGDGKIDSLIMSNNCNINIKGIDVLVRPDTYIDVIEYDGRHIPYDDGSFDTVMAIDVLHHTDDPLAVVREMTRVTSKYIIIKDHLCESGWDRVKLRAMDYVGNAHYSVRLPYNYLADEEWKLILEECGLKTLKRIDELGLYKGLFHLLFDGKLHFLLVLEK